MKTNLTKKITLLLLVLVSFLSFRMKAQSIPINIISYLEGDWTWLKSCGGLAYSCNSPTTVGYTKGLTFSRITGVNDSIAYIARKNGTLVHVGKTKIIPPSGQTGSYILDNIQDEATGYGMTLTLTQTKQDTTWMTESCMDCYTRIYYRSGTVGLKEQNLDREELKVYPVPALDRIQVTLKSISETSTLQFFDITGRQVHLRAIGKEEYDTSELAPGIYFVRISTTSGESQAKFLKR